jgi:glycosyltransferase involved in cell wall biosynthesis
MGFAFTSAARQSGTRFAIAAVYRRLARLAYGHPNKRVIVQNADDERLIVEDRLARPREIVLIAGSGVELRQSCAAVTSQKASIVLFPARMLVDKGVLEFVDAARIVGRSAPGWRFIMAGAADYRNPSSVPRQRLEQFQKEGLIEWLGHVEDMRPLYDQASIVCLPSYREGMPKALLEAAAAGCAVVTTDTTGCRESVIPGVTGDLVPVRDSAALARALLSLIQDSARRESYGQAGEKLARERFGLEGVVRRTMELYEELLRHD